jgi:hypothetical protein
MLKDIVAVQPLGLYTLRLQFEDGVAGVVDVSQLVEFKGVFAPLQDLDYFGQVAVDPDLGTVAWRNGADLDPDVLYAVITGQAIQLAGLPNEALR